MSKYSPLGEFLQAQSMTEVPMSFVEVEQVIGCTLPASSKYPAWWSNNPSNNVMTEVWLDAGFQTERVDVTGRKLVFRRVHAKPPTRPAGQIPPSTAPTPTSSRRHPIFGCMKGLITIMPGVDLTEPADPSWGKDA